VQHDGSAGLVFHKRPVDSGLTDFVLFMPSGKTDLAISNTIQPSLRTAEVTFSTVELHEKSKIPLSNDVVYILCTLDPSAKKAVAATDKRYWVYDLNYELEEPYNRQDGDSVQLQLYRNSIIEPDHKITGYALTTARTRPSLGRARSGQDIRGKELSPVQAQGTTPGGLLPNGDSDEMETVELRSGQIGFFPRASSDESSSAGADTVILPKRRISVDEKGRFQAQLRLEETPEEKQVVAKPLDQSSQPAKLHLVIGVQLIRGAEIAFNQGNDAFRRDKRDSAVASYKKAVELEPDNVEYLLRLGFASERTGDLKTAIASYRKAVELNPNDADTLYTLGLATEKSGDLKAAQEYYRKAVTSYKRALELNPDDAAGLYNFGLALGKTGDLKAATASYKKALELKPDDADTLINLGWALQKTGDFEAAIAPYKKALELKPNDADALYTLGLATEKSGDLKAAKEYYQKAVTSYKRAIELNPDDAAGLYSLGLAIEKTGDFEAAQEYYRKAVGSYREAVELKPDDADALNNLGLAIEKTGDFEAAQEYYRKAVAVRPEDAQIQNNLAWDLVKLKCFADALEPAQKAVELTPKDPSPWDTYAHAAFGIEWWDAAAKGWDKVIELQGKLSDKLSEPECADDEDKWKKAHENSGIPLPAPVPEKSKK
jgi:tetratricopeptide (TPR) repeat protein